MASYAGPAPWSSGFKALNRDTSSRGYVPGRGWRKTNPNDEWRKMPKRTATKVIRNPLTGRNIRVPVQDIDDYIQMMNAGSPDDQVMQFTAERGLGIEEGMAAYVEEAFDDKHKHYKIEGCGHIKLLEYNIRRQVMRVTFTNNDACVAFFRVPIAVFGELYSLAESKVESRNTFDGSVRHVLGIRFWDIVRIRGSMHGSRYRFTYVSGGGSGGSGGRPKKYDTDQVWKRYKTERKDGKQGRYVTMKIPINSTSEADAKMLSEVAIQGELYDRVEEWDTDCFDSFMDNHYDAIRSQVNSMPASIKKEQADKALVSLKKHYDAAEDNSMFSDVIKLGQLGFNIPAASELM